jgi:hypothetical protein
MQLLSHVSETVQWFKLSRTMPKTIAIGVSVIFLHEEVSTEARICRDLSQKSDAHRASILWRLPCRTSD